MPSPPQPAATRRVAFAEAFRFWLKLGFVSFGGPAGQIALMHRELVERRRWLSEERFLHALNFCMLLPGPEAQQLAIYVGWLMHRTAGGVVAGALFVLPSVLILLLLSYVYAAYGDAPSVAGVLAGFKPIVVAIVAEAVVRIGGRALKRRVHLFIAAAAFLSIYFLAVPFPAVVLAAALAGLCGAQVTPGVSAATREPTADAGKVEGEERADARRATVVDDFAAPPAHTIPDRARNLRVLAAGLLLWALPLVLLVLWRGRSSLHLRLYLFFTQAALVTFGGAYAVLAYVTQAIVADHGWITPAQAADGLALAETTPGPLIMVLQFVGFVAAWNNPEGMSRAASAVTGALVTTYATFLPCFLFIFLGAPYIERLRGSRNLTAALSGVTAAVVGVILNLALVFGEEVIFPRGRAGGVEWFALALCAAGMIALRKFEIDVLWVVFAGGLAGLARTLLT